MFRILLFLFFTFTILFSQTWKNTVTLNVTAGNNDRIDLFTDKSGNHIIVQNDNTLKYYLYSYNGTLVRSATIDNYSESNHLSAITGYNGKIYVVYKKNNQMLTKKSINSGRNWTSNIAPISMNHSTSDGMDIAADGNGVYLVWSEKYGEPNYFETRYARLGHEDYGWTDFKQVTDYGNDKGGHPAVTVSPDRIFVAYAEADNPNPYASHSQSAGVYKIRTKYNGVWQNPETVSYSTYSAKIIADEYKLNSFSYNPGDISLPDGLWDYEFIFQNRNLSGGYWANYQNADQGNETIYVTEEYRADLAKSNDNSIHFVFNGHLYRRWNGSQFGSQYNFGNGTDAKISANGTDVYITWIENGHVKLKQRDYPPIAPRNVSISPNENDHPLLQWDANPEADLRRYRVYRLNHDPNNFIVYGTSFVDEDVEVSQSGTDIEYCVKAEDWYGNLSDASDQVGIHGYLGKRMVQNPSDNQTMPKEYKLYQNYPNPFNPITKIRFDLPKESFVSLVVLNINGQLVKKVFKGFLDAGKYQFPFDGSSLPSGIYIYRLKAKNYVSIKKMILTK